MDKLTLSVSPEEWGHLITKYRPDAKKVSPADFTNGTVNVESDTTGSLTKRKGGPNYNTTPLAAPTKDQYEAIFSDGARHLLVVQSGEVKYSSGDNIFNTVVNGTGFSATGNFEFALTQDRVYGGNGINAPIVYDRATNYGGVVYTAPRIKVMGAQAPSSAPTAGAPTAGGNVPDGAHTYKITYLYYDSEESNGSPASGVQTAGAGNNTIPLTAIPIGGYGVTARKIYRDNNDGLWLHIATLADNTTTIFSDTINVGATPTEIPEFNNTPPTFSRVTLWLDQLWVSGVPGDPSTLFYSDTEHPDIFNPANQILCNQEDPITAHIVYYDRLIVFNRRSMGQILGKTSDTYRYAAIPTSVGCVDNRTLQIRVVNGVPILIWLSDRGFYSYDGNSINYISDEIEDLVNFNIQQALQQKSSVSQSSFSGTAEDGISLTEIPGSVTTRGYLNGTSTPGTNPRRNWDDTTDWEGAAINTNTRTKDGDNTLKVPTRFAPAFAEGSLSGVINNTTNISLATVPDVTGQSNLAGTTVYENPTDNTSAGFASISPHGGAQPITMATTGTISSITVVLARIGAGTSGASTTVRLRIWNDLLGQPGTALWTGINRVYPFLFSQPRTTYTESPNLNVTAGSIIWIGVEYVSGGGTSAEIYPDASVAAVSANWGIYKFKKANGTWAVPSGYVTGSPGPAASSTNIIMSYSFIKTAVPKSGQYTSQIYDTKSTSIVSGLAITHTGSYPAGSFSSGPYSTSATTFLEGSNNATFAGGAEVVESFMNVNGIQAFTLAGKRYWRIRISIATTDDRATPTAGLPVLTFNITATWESETIDTTLQSTVYDSLSTTSTLPSGTSVVTTIATSASAIGPWTGSGNGDGQFGAFGSHIVRQYVRVRLVLSANAGDILTPSVSSVIFRWTLSAKYTSTIIDTGVNPPAGWDLFLSDFLTNGGTVVFEMRSATTSGGIPAATFFTVVPGDFPSAVTPNQFTQWRVTLTSSDEDVPRVDSVTIQWFISQISSLRPASIFVDGRYYVALAEIGSSINNVLLHIDLNGKWRRSSGLNISTFSFFFNRPYFGLAESGQIRKFLDGTTDAGTDIIFDWRTKAFDFSTQYQSHSSKMKVVGELILQGVNTGAEFEVSYSVDNGATFIPMLTDQGAATFTTGTDGTNFYARFRPSWDGSNPISGRTIMYRVFNDDENEVSIRGLELVAFLRKQAPVITG